MDANNSVESTISGCKCGIGKMLLKCAGIDARHAGRMYYKCPAHLIHDRSFIWCDEYHKYDLQAMMPHYMKYQTYNRNETPRSPSTATGEYRPNPMGIEHEPKPGRMSPELPLPFMAMASVFIMFGFLLGKFT